MTRIAFLGTPEAAVPSLQALQAIHEVGLVVTQPDRPKGRSRKPSPPPVKQAAIEAGLQVCQPESAEDLKEALVGAGGVEIAVVVAYGRILRPDALEVPGRGMLNVHFSLLPRWRGAAPVNRAVMAGDTMTGVTIIKIDEALDAGPVLTAQAVDIGSTEDAGELTARLAGLGARLVSESIEPYLNEELVPQPQSEEGLTYASKLTPEDRPIAPKDPVAKIVNQVRGLSPTPAATLALDGEVYKIFEVSASTARVPEGEWVVVEDKPVFGAAGGSVLIERLQPPGKKPMDSADWIRGRTRHAGIVGE